jgi:predicted ester cyclase
VKTYSKQNNERNFTKEIIRNLLASRCIIDSYNIGDIAGIKKIITETMTMDCDVCVFPLNQRLKGTAALIDVWEAMLQAFPDGVFRASDTTINDKGELITRFVFSGAKQFNIVLGGNSLNGAEVEMGEIINEDDESISGLGINCEIESKNESIKEDLSNIRSSIKNSAKPNKANSSKSKKKITFQEAKPTSLLAIVSTTSVTVDYSRALIRSVDLLIEDAKIRNYEGRMVLHTNEEYQINRLDYYWINGIRTFVITPSVIT